jgi:hypothetical protein
VPGRLLVLAHDADLAVGVAVEHGRVEVVRGGGRVIQRLDRLVVGLGVGKPVI